MIACYSISFSCRRVARIYQRGTGGHCLMVWVLTDCHVVFAACCRLLGLKRLANGKRGVGGGEQSRTPQNPISLRPCLKKLDFTVCSIEILNG